MATTEVRIAPEVVGTTAPRSERLPDPGIVVIFGASGDLTKRKLLPALFHLEQQGLLPAGRSALRCAIRASSAARNASGGFASSPKQLDVPR